MSTNRKRPSRTTARGSGAKTPRRREIMAAVFFILAAFSFIAYFSTDGAFIGVFAGLVKGLVGRGFYALFIGLPYLRLRQGQIALLKRIRDR